ncbi:MAG: biotin/lipoyl-binding protein [Clostridiaceae bacterium]|jgi:multidrug efflux pump subunit AcrA (membrane-fusion protein)|nr:biotin/lipoyl-binding protein [Clostridia bacterium]MBP6949383.1 biotin/lipoyl-binding protein [Clostridia bacterium]NMA36404.1 biotin/lipoyl-binding protein [Clostridiaceae bacterium]
MVNEQPSNTTTKKKINYKRLLIRAAIALVLVAIVAVPFLSHNRNSLLAVNTTVVKRGDVDEFLSFDARIVPKEIQKVMASGQTVLQVHVEEGEEVKRGQLLLTLDMSELERTLEERKQALDEQNKLMRDIESLIATLKRTGRSLDLSKVSELTGNANELLTKLNELATGWQDMMNKLPSPSAELIKESFGRINGILSNSDELMEKVTKFVEDTEAEVERLRESIADNRNDATLLLLKSRREELVWMRAMLDSSEMALEAAYDYVLSLLDDLSEGDTDPALIESMTELLLTLESRLSETRQLIARIDQLLEEIDALIEEIEDAMEQQPAPTAATHTVPAAMVSASDESTKVMSLSTSTAVSSGSNIRIGRPRLQASGVDSALLSQTAGQGLDIFSLLTSGMGQYGQLMGLFDNSVEAAEKALAEAKPEVRADFDGTIVHLNVKEGDQPSVFSSTLLLEVYKRGDFEAIFQANENDAHRLEKGDKVEYLFAGMAFHGEIVFKAPIAESASDLLGQSSFDLGGILGGVGGMSPTVTVRMSVNGENLDKLTPGFNIRADIEIGHKTDVLTVPVESLIRDKGRDCVLCLGENDVVAIVPVTLGLQGATTVEIIAGIALGDVVVVNPNPDIKDGSRVAIKNHTP